MAGTSEGARKARDTNLSLNPNYYAELREKRKTPSKGGAFRDRKFASQQGRKGGAAPRRRKAE